MSATGGLFLLPRVTPDNAPICCHSSAATAVSDPAALVWFAKLRQELAGHTARGQ
jgi:hypothetical protein